MRGAARQPATLEGSAVHTCVGYLAPTCSGNVYKLLACMQLASSGAGRTALVDGDAGAIGTVLGDAALAAELGKALHDKLMLPDTLVRTSLTY